MCGTILDEPQGEGGFGYDPLFRSDDLGGASAGGEAEKGREPPGPGVPGCSIGWPGARVDTSNGI
jgi:hypothetical protein